MKKFLKLSSFLMVMILALFLVGTIVIKAKEPVTLNLRMGVYSPVEMIKAFEKENPNIKINWIKMPSNSDAVHDNLVTMLSSGDNSTDIFSVDCVWPAEFAAAGWALPLDKYVSAAERKEFLAGPLRTGTYKGHIYALPLFTDGGMLYYRKDLLEAKGLKPPTTWDELIKVAQAVQTENIIGFSWQGAQYEGLICNVLEYIWANGGDVLDEKGKLVFNSPNTINAIQFMADLVNKYKITPVGVSGWHEEESLKVFLDGRAVFMRNWPYAWHEVEKSNIKGKVGVVPMPKGPMGKGGAATLGGWDLVVNKNSKYKAEAIKFIKFATGVAGQKAMIFENGVIPTRAALYSDPEVLKSYPYYKEFYNVFINAVPRPVSPMYPKISDAMQLGVHSVLTGEKTAKDVVPNLANSLKRFLK